MVEGSIASPADAGDVIPGGLPAEVNDDPAANGVCGVEGLLPAVKSTAKGFTAAAAAGDAVPNGVDERYVIPEKSIESATSINKALLEPCFAAAVAATFAVRMRPEPGQSNPEAVDPNRHHPFYLASLT